MTVPTITRDVPGDIDPADVERILATVAAVERAQWRRDPDAFLSLFTPNAVWVTAFGKRLCGRDEIDAFTRRVLTPAIGDHYARYDVLHISFLRDDVAVVNVRQRPVDGADVAQIDEPEGRPVYVMTKHDERWLLAAGQNTRHQDDAIRQQAAQIAEPARQ